MPTFSLFAAIRALLVWLLIIVTESAQGALRRLLLSPEVDFALRLISVVVGAATIFAITWFLLDWIKIRSARGALAIGGLWVVLTLAFEVSLGRLTGLGWRAILADYNLTQGGLMPLGILAMALTPWAVRELRTRRERPLTSDRNI